MSFDGSDASGPTCYCYSLDIASICSPLPLLRIVITVRIRTLERNRLATVLTVSPYSQFSDSEEWCLLDLKKLARFSTDVGNFASHSKGASAPLRLEITSKELRRITAGGGAGHIQGLEFVADPRSAASRTSCNIKAPQGRSIFA